MKNALLSFLIGQRCKRIRHFSENPIHIQNKVLTELISKAKNTEFGMEHKFHLINNYIDYINYVPLRKYEDFYPFIDRTRKGVKNVIWPTKINLYSKSSGTTNSRSKYIPVTKESLFKCHFKAGKDMLALYTSNFGNTNIYSGKGLMLGGSLDKLNSRLYQQGDLSAILIDKFPYWVNMHRVPDKNTALMPNWEEKINRIAEQAIKSNITNLTGVPSWMLVLLKHILNITGKDNLSEIWPNLEVFFHGGVSFGPYRSQFNEVLSNSNMNYLEGYNGSEGFFAIQDLKDSQGLLLLLDHGIFYEFIDLKEYNEGKNTSILLDEVKLGVNYVLVISTNAGLWRYVIGDVISFTSIKPFRVRVVGRTKSFLNAFGEEVIVEDADRALLETCKKFQAIFNEYTVAPFFISNKSSARHQWLIDFSKEPKDINQFAKVLDENLKKLNSDYAAKRSNNLVLKQPEVILIKNNEFYKWLKHNNRLGGQNKIPRLSNDRKIVEFILHQT